MATINDAFRVKNNLIVLGNGTSTVGGALQVAGALTGVTTQNMSGQLTNTLAIGTAPFVITSTTRVANLNVASAGLADTVTTNANLTGNVTSVGNATTIATNVVANSMLAQVATASFLGRVTAATGNVETLTATQARSILNVADGATANVGTVTSVGGTGTVNGLTLTGSVTSSGNLTLGGTLSGIANGALSNSTVTIGSTSVALGATATTFAGLTSVTSTTFVGALTGNASTATSLASGAANQIHYQTGAGVSAFLSTANNGVLITSGAGVPSISSTLPTGLTISNILGTVSSAVSAAGTTQGTATAITSDYNAVTTVAAGTGVILPTTTAGRKITVANKGANALLVYPPTSSAIDALATNVGYSLAVGAVMVFFASTATLWYSDSVPGGVGTVTSVGGTGTVNGLSLTGTVTTSGNLTLGGTLSGIGNAALTNSAVTIGSTAVSLGATVTTFAGLASVTSTTFVGALSGNATTATTATNIAGGTANQIPYQTGAGATAFYGGANYGVQTYTATGVPSSVAGAAGVLQGSASVIPTFTTTPTLTGTNFTGIPNGALTNSSLTIGSTSVALGSTTTTFTGLVSVTSTTFVGALTGSATQLGGVAAASYALLAGPTFTGTPLSTTAAVGTNTTQIATTAFVTAEKLAPRTQTVASNATVTPTSLDEIVTITALTVGTTIANPTGTYASNQSYVIAIFSAAAQTLAWGTSFQARTGTLPATTVAGEWAYYSVSYNATAAKHIVMTSSSGGGGGTTTNALTINNGGAGVASGGTFNGSAAITISYNSIGAAPLASPTFTGTPLSTTAAVGTNTTQIATTAFVTTEKLTPRTQTTASSATVTPTSLDEVVNVTALAVACNFANPTGTYASNQSYIIAVKDNGTARALTWGTSFQARTGTLPNTTVIGEWSYFSVTYNATAAKHIVLQSAASAAGTTTNPVTFNSGGAGSASGITFNGASAITISHNTIGAAPLASPTFSGTPVLTTTTTVGASGPVVGFRDIPITISNAAKTFALVDAGKGFGKDNTTAYTYTIPANASVAFPIGTAITVFNGNATSDITIAITTDTLRLGGTTTTGSRTLAPWGSCTLYKIAATIWLASGAGLT